MNENRGEFSDHGCCVFYSASDLKKASAASPYNPMLIFVHNLSGNSFSYRLAVTESSFEREESDNPSPIRPGR